VVNIATSSLSHYLLLVQTIFSAYRYESPSGA
jgi:hypothetical protein